MDLKLNNMYVLKSVSQDSFFIIVEEFIDCDLDIW